uniref:transglycosylase domain-containing protein n=1 Tax=Flavobacterium sp. TaxID=239 RepID=UPI004048FFF4
MKHLIKIFKLFSVIFMIFVFGFYLVLSNSWKLYYDKNDLNLFTTEIKKSSELPIEFYELYNKSNNNSLDVGVINYLSKSIVYIPNNKPVSIWVSNLLFLKYRKDKVFYKILKPDFSLALKLESKTTSNEQLNWMLENYDFLYNQIGIKSAAKFYFKKELNELNRTELATFVVMTKNPSLFNPIRRPERVKREVDLLLNK